MMIYLRFPSSQDEMVQYVEIKKPNYSGVLETALKEWYTNSLAAKYAKILADSLYEVMDFPQDGIYYVNPETQTFFFFSKKSNLWVDTKKKIEDYVISSTDKLWEAIFSKHSFLKKVAKLIQSTVEKETKKLFKADTWENVSSIDLDSGNVSAVGQEEDILNIFMWYFSKKRANELYLKVKKTLFFTTSNSIVILFEKEILKGMLTADGYKRFDKSAFDQLKEMFSEVLAKYELNRFVLRFRNLMLWGTDYAGFPILEVKNNNSGGKDLYVDYNGLRLLCDPSCYFAHYYTDNVSLETLEAIAKIVRSHFKNGKIKLEDEDDIIVQGLSFSYCVLRNGRALELFRRESDDHLEITHLEFAMVRDGNLIFDFDSYKNKPLCVKPKK